MLPFALAAGLVWLMAAGASAQDTAADCAAKAYGPLEKDRALEVCHTGTPFTGDCVKQVYGSFDREQTVALCRTATAETASCALKAYGKFTREEAVRLCGPKRN